MIRSAAMRCAKAISSHPRTDAYIPTIRTIGLVAASAHAASRSLRSVTAGLARAHTTMLMTHRVG
jgi:hypothetical protein